MRKKLSGEMLALVKRDRLNKHLVEVEEIIGVWVAQLKAPNSMYVPALEREPGSNHVLHKHLRKRAFWRCHSEWELRVSRVQGQVGETEEWRQIRALEEKMHNLATRAIKQGDILYPCQFCRRLWND